MAYEDPSPGSTSDGRTTDVAKEQAGRVGQKASEAGGQVAQTTKEQAQNVVGEAKQQARDLVGEARTQVKDQAGTQRDRAALGLYALSDELDQMAQQGGQSGLATEMARQVSGRTRDLAEYLERHEPSDLLAEIRSYARRRPVVFLAGAALAGVVAGRLTKGIVAGPPDDDGPRSLTSGYPDTYQTSQPLPLGSAEPYGTAVAAPDYASPGYEGSAYQTPAYGTAGYAAPDDYTTTGGGFRSPDAGPAGSEYAPAGYPDAGQGGYAEGGQDGYPDAGQADAPYPPVQEPVYDPTLDPEQPPARGWTP